MTQGICFLFEEPADVSDAVVGSREYGRTRSNTSPADGTRRTVDTLASRIASKQIEN